MLRRLLIAGPLVGGLIALGGILGYSAGEASDGGRGYFFGFAIGRQLVESNCGRNEPSVGTTFTIDLPGG